MVSNKTPIAAVVKKAGATEKPSSAELRREFWAAPVDALFPRETMAAVRNCSLQTIEAEAIRGGGVPYRKIGKRCYYRKGDFLAWVDKHCPLVENTAQLPAAARRTARAVEEVAA